MSKPTPITLGIDEAGRGAVLGPLVLAGCAVSPAQEEILREAGVADSKGFGPPARAQGIRADLAALIGAKATWYAVITAPPDRVDASVRRHGLNALERALAEEILGDAPPDCRVVLDGHRVFAPLCRRVGRATAIDKADQHEISVAAASILAKNTRDKLFGQIRHQYEPDLGPIGGEGYPNRATARFLDAYVELHGDLPPETRRSWQWAPLMRYTTPEQRGDPPSLHFE
jgi:ribonuclease HII